MIKIDSNFKFYSCWYGFSDGKLVMNFMTQEGVQTIQSNLRPYGFVDSRSASLVEQISKNKKICTTIKITSMLYKFIFDTNLPISKLEVDSPKQISTLRDECRGISFYEADIPYARRYMIDNDLQVSTDYKRLYWDTEILTEVGQLGVLKTLEGKLPIVAIGAVDDSGNKVVFIGSNYEKTGDLKQLTKEQLFEDENQIFDKFFKLLSEKKYTLLIGWNTEEFDTPILWKRVSLHERSWYFRFPKQSVRFLDLYKCFRKTRYNLWNSWKLEDVSYKMFGGKKMFKLSEKSLLSLSPKEISVYVVDDAEKVRFIDILDTVFKGDTLTEKQATDAITKQEARLSDYFTELAAYTHLFPDETLSAVKCADGLLLKRARNMNYVLPSKPERSATREFPLIEGAFVKAPTAGVYEYVLNLDFNSLYPNIIIFWKISPDPEGRMYPEMLKELIAKRKECKTLYEESKKQGKPMEIYNTKQQAFKILANAAYGAFVYENFRLFDREKGGEVTRHGRELINFVIDFVEKDLKYTVEYGDTDSIFLKLGKKPEDITATSRILSDLISDKLKEVNGQEFQIYMEPQKMYDKILFTNKKKKYYGHICWEWNKGMGKIVDYYDVVGFEKRRSDWTDLAKEVQTVIAESKLGRQDQKVKEYLSTLELDLFLGKLDSKLIISKSVTKDVSLYKSVPPHVRAYKELLDRGIILEGGKIQYVITLEGPKAIIDGTFPKEPLDYVYYWNKQVCPIGERLGVEIDEKGNGKHKKVKSESLDKWWGSGSDMSQ